MGFVIVIVSAVSPTRLASVTVSPPAFSSLDEMPPTVTLTSAVLPPGFLLQKSNTIQLNGLGQFSPGGGIGAPAPTPYVYSAIGHTPMSATTVPHFVPTPGGGVFTQFITRFYGRMRVTQGTDNPGGFGGTMDVIGDSTVQLFIASAGGNVNELNIVFPFGPGVPMTSPTFAKRTVKPGDFKVHLGSISGPTVATIPGTLWHTLFPWTTGKVEAIASTLVPSTGTTTVRTETGFDNRNTAGTAGTIQLVSGSLMNQYGVGTPFVQKQNAMTRMTRIKFVPEPGTMLLLGCGTAALAGLYVAERRRH